MQRLVRPLPLLAAALLCAAVRGASAQGHPALSITAPAPEELTRAGPVVVASHMLSGRKLQELLANGFPVRLHFSVELWSVGTWSNEVQRIVEWDVVVRWLQVERTYDVTQIVNDRPFSLGRFPLLSDAEAAVGRPTRASITAVPSARRLYYQASLSVETLSVTDIDEVERWLHGELEPAVRGHRNPGSALSRGIRTLFSRLAGGERREYAERTPIFRVSEPTR